MSFRKWLAKYLPEIRNAMQNRANLPTELDINLVQASDLAEYLELYRRCCDGEKSEVVKFALLNPPYFVKKEADNLFEMIKERYKSGKLFKLESSITVQKFAAIHYLLYTEKICMIEQTRLLFFDRNYLMPLEE